MVSGNRGQGSRIGPKPQVLRPTLDNLEKSGDSILNPGIGLGRRKNTELLDFQFLINSLLVVFGFAGISGNVIFFVPVLVTEQFPRPFSLLGGKISGVLHFQKRKVISKISLEN